MGKDIIRPDWQLPAAEEPVARDQLWNDWNPPVTTDLDLPHDELDNASPEDVLAPFTDQQVEVWDFVSSQIISDHPDPEGFAGRFDCLHGAVRRKVIATVIAKPHLRGLALIKAVEGKLTLQEAVWAKRDVESYFHRVDIDWLGRE